MKKNGIDLSKIFGIVEGMANVIEEVVKANEENNTSQKQQNAKVDANTVFHNPNIAEAIMLYRRKSGKRFNEIHMDICPNIPFMTFMETLTEENCNLSYNEAVAMLTKMGYVVTLVDVDGDKK